MRSAAVGRGELPFHAPEERRPEHRNWPLAPGEAGRLVWFTFLPRSEAAEETDGVAPAEPGEQALGPANVAPERLVIVLVRSRAPVDQPLAALVGALLLVGGTVELAVCLAVTLGVGWALHPLTRMAEQVSSRAGRSLSRPIDDAGAPSELVPLYAELNRMLERVQQTIDRERSFADAAAHELRTPLAELRAAAEVAMRFPGAKPAESALQEVLEIGAELERLVESLLLVSRAQHAVEGGASEPAAPLRAIADSILAQSQEVIERKRLQVRVQVPPDLCLRSSPDAWQIILRNLIDNAVEHTPPQGFVTLRATVDRAGGPLLLIENGPVTLEQEEVSRLFVPFWRRDSARDQTRHVGLGLTIVQQLAAAFGAQVSAGLVPEGLRISVSCPASRTV